MQASFTLAQAKLLYIKYTLEYTYQRLTFDNFVQ